jgi:hypothetical protein
VKNTNGHRADKYSRLAAAANPSLDTNLDGLVNLADVLTIKSLITPSPHRALCP